MLPGGALCCVALVAAVVVAFAGAASCMIVCLS
jgi:hypothetical protein